MTFFSSMSLNIQRRGGRKLLGSPQAMHAAVMSAFEPGTMEGLPGRVLWRVDKDGPAYRLYLVSPTEPDLTHIVEQAGWTGQQWQTALYDPFLERLRAGQEWSFRLTANPVMRKNKSGGHGKIMPHQTVPQQTQWLITHSEKLGFEIPAVPLDVAEDEEPMCNVKVTGRYDARFARGKEPRADRQPLVTIRQVQYDGLLRISDVALFRKHLISGIGRGKAYGCGLMTLKRGE